MPKPPKPEDEIQDEAPTIPRTSLLDGWELKKRGTSNFYWEYATSGAERPATFTDVLFYEILQELKQLNGKEK